jgi:hypothetical protein
LTNIIAIVFIIYDVVGNFCIRKENDETQPFVITTNAKGVLLLRKRLQD